jgi:ferredoxin/flavodoxin---NADP+ reductase
MLRVAVVGSGPAGAYTAGALAERGDVAVDVLDRLPCPYGLVRYGVAPDHPKIKSISRTLQKVFEDPAVRFLGNVAVGTDLTLDELHRRYDAVVLAVGAAIDRRLGVPGEDLPGSHSATELVAWYSGHPDAATDGFDLAARSVAVVGAGNVALDVARLLAKTADELRTTDLPDHVLAVLEASRVTDVHVVARRGPAQARFTTKELRELGDLAHADVLLDPADLDLDAASRAVVDEDAVARRNVDTLRGWAEREPAGRPRRIHLHFWRRPVEVCGEAGVRGLVLERTALDEAGRAAGTGETGTVDVQMVFRAVGYRSLPVPGMPFDDEAGVIPHAEGRVLRDGVVSPGEYVAGWVKRGPTGVIGTNKNDAKETVASLLADAPTLPPAPDRDPDAVLRLLDSRGVDVVTWDGWRAIEHAETDLGEAQGRDRTKITDRAALLALAREAGPPVSPGEP